MEVLRFQGPDRSAVEYAKELLARCEAGETVSVIGVEFSAEATYRVLGSQTHSRLLTAGALLEAAVTRLQAE